MTLALATRGYLCRTGPGGPVLPGPTIIGTQSLTPSLAGSTVSKVPGPSITGAGVPGPSISGGDSPAEPAAGDTPTIDGAGVLSPGITGGKEE